MTTNQTPKVIAKLLSISHLILDVIYEQLHAT